MTKRAPLSLVAVGAHPDDIELSMGGLMIQAARAGHRVTWIIATDGAAGNGGRDSQLAERRRAEAESSAALCGAEPIWLGFPDGQLAWHTEAKATLGRHLAALAPTLIVTHATNDYHADHRAAARMVGDTAPLGSIILRSDNMLGRHFEPALLIDISDSFQIKLEALACHESQNGLSLSETVTTWNRFRGLQSAARRFAYAEAYRYDQGVGVDVQPVLNDLGPWLLL